MWKVATPRQELRRKSAMNTKMTVSAAMVTVLLVAGACSPSLGASPAKETNIEVTIDELATAQHVARQIELSDGGVLTVSLGSNPTTGFGWTEAAQIGDPTVLQQTESKFLPPENQGLVGASGTQVWTFRALQKGATTISMEYGRPWEGGEKGVWTFELTVTVK
jgi:inhibitor of cysteine peptidase